MTSDQLKTSILRVFVQFYKEQNEEQLLNLSLISRRVAHSVASQRRIRSVELNFYRIRDEDYESRKFLSVCLKSDKRINRRRTHHTLTSAEELMTSIVCLKLLFYRKTKFSFVIELDTRNFPIPWFKENVAVKTGRMIKDFFPHAKFKLFSTASVAPGSYHQMKRFISELAPVLRNAICATKELELLEEADLNVFRFPEHWKSPKEDSSYYPPLFSVKAKELFFEDQFLLGDFIHGSYPAQRKAEILNCTFEAEVQPHPTYYEDIFKEISSCLPNLKFLRCVMHNIGMPYSNPGSREKLVDGKMPDSINKPIENAVWHIKEVCRHSHIKTKIYVYLAMRTNDYVEATANLFSELLTGSQIKEEPYDIPMERSVFYKQKKTNVVVNCTRL